MRVGQKERQTIFNFSKFLYQKVECLKRLVKIRCPVISHKELWAVCRTMALTSNSKTATPINLLPNLFLLLKKWYSQSRSDCSAYAGFAVHFLCTVWVAKFCARAVNKLVHVFWTSCGLVHFKCLCAWGVQVVHNLVHKSALPCSEQSCACLVPWMNKSLIAVSAIPT